MMLWAMVCLVLLCNGYALDISLSDFIEEEELKPRKVIEEVIAYFQQKDPHGIPVLNIPEPLYINGTFSSSGVSVGNLSVSGHSQLRLEHFLVSLHDLQGQINLSTDFLNILGNYVWSGFLGASEGDLNATFTNLQAGGSVIFTVNDDGILQLLSIEPKLSNENFDLDMTGLSWHHEATVYAGQSLFDILGFVEDQISSEALPQINPILWEKLHTYQLPTDILPIDYYVAKLSSTIAKQHFLDPFIIPKKEISLPIPISLLLTNLELRGISTIHRAGVLETEYLDNKVYFRVEFGTQKLNLKTDYSASTSLFSISSGTIHFTIESFRILVDMFQSSDVSHPPTLRKVDVELGNFAFLSEGDGNMDYLMEAIVNVVPNILRNEYLDKKLEEAIHNAVQDSFNTMDVEEIITDSLDENFPEQ